MALTLAPIISQQMVTYVGDITLALASLCSHAYVSYINMKIAKGIKSFA